MAENGPGATAELSFEAFCRKVLAYYPKLKQQGAIVEIAIARKLEARDGFLPRIRGLASMTKSDDPVYVFGTLLKQGAFTQEDFALSRLNNPRARTNYDIGLHGEIPILDSMQTVYRVRQARHIAESARYDEAFSRMEALLVASDAYLNAVAVEKVLNAAQEACLNSEADIKQAQELKDKGMVLGADFYAAKVILGGLRSMKNELTAQKESMHALLNILMGEDPIRPVKLADTIGEGQIGSRDLKDWLSDAYRSRPDILSIEEAMQAKEARVSQERSSALPNISAFGDLKENTNDLHTGGGSYAIGLKGSIDLFEPGHSERVKIAKGELKKLQYDKDIVRDQISKDVTSEYARFGSIQSNIPILREMADDSARAVELMAPLYREGRKSIADLLDMRQGYVRIYQSYYAAMAGLRISGARLLYLSGKLDESDICKLTQKGE